ncbi:MAG TPA: insulinase family protein, partial [Polyangia bacterium]|nr:insulinase family protein [Polyangia bacterium]
RPPRLIPRTGAQEMLGRAADPVLNPAAALNPESMLAFMVSLSGLPPPTEDTDIERVDAFQVPGAQATLLVCRVKLRQGSHPEHSAENVLDRLRRMWYRTSPLQEQAHYLTVQLTRAAVVARMILDAEDPVERGLLTAQWAHLGSDPRMYTRTLGAVLETTPGHIEDFAWDHLTRKRARMLYVTPLQASPSSARVAGSGRAIAGAEAVTAAPGFAPAAIGDLGRPLDMGAFRTRKLGSGVEVIAARRTGIPVLTLGLSLGGGTATERPLGVVEVAAHVATVGHRFGKPSDFGARAWGENAPDGIRFFLRSGADHVGKMLAILSDRLKNQAVPGGAVDDFRKYTLPLLAKQEQTPSSRADLAFWTAMYGDHPYARRASSADLQRIRGGEVERWLRWAYRPDNATVVVVGDFEPERALELAEYWLGDWKSDAHLPKGEVSVEFQPLGKAPPPPVRPPGSIVLVTDRPGATQAQLRFGCLLPETSDERRAVAYDLAAEIVERRMDEVVRSRLGAGSYVHASATMLAGGTSSLVAGASVASGDLPAVLQALRADRDGLAAGSFSDAELDRARWSLARKYEIHYTTSQAIVEAVLEARKRGLELESIQRYPTHLAMVQRGEVQAAFSACRERDVLSLVGPEATLRAAMQAGWQVVR